MGHHLAHWLAAAEARRHLQGGWVGVRRCVGGEEAPRSIGAAAAAADAVVPPAPRPAPTVVTHVAAAAGGGVLVKYLLEAVVR